jgi:hypothetical protein
MAVHDKVLPPTLNCEKPEPEHRLRNSPFYLLPRAARLGTPRNGPAPRRRQRLRLRRHQLPRGAGGIRAGHACRRRRGLCRGRRSSGRSRSASVAPVPPPCHPALSTSEPTHEQETAARHSLPSAQPTRWRTEGQAGRCLPPRRGWLGARYGKRLLNLRGKRPDIRVEPASGW